MDGNKLRLKMCLLLQSVNENMHQRIRRLVGQARTLLCPVRVSCTECTKHVLLALTSYIFLSFRFVTIIGMVAQAAKDKVAISIDNILGGFDEILHLLYQYEINAGGGGRCLEDRELRMITVTLSMYTITAVLVSVYLRFVVVCCYLFFII